MNVSKINSKPYLRYSILIMAGIFLGWAFFHSPRTKTGNREESLHSEENAVWTCAMHPHIRMHEPGKCPICGMDLVPLGENPTTTDSTTIHLTAEAVELANVQTSIVSRQQPVKEVRLYGKVQPDERLLQSQVAHISGRIEELIVNYTGQSVQKGQTLALIYSPELITAQQELIEASKTREAYPEIYEAAREKLRQWKIQESRIDEIGTTGNITSNVEVVANASGIVTTLRVNKGDYISRGTVLFEVADLSKVWVLFDAYESDLQYLSKGDNIDFTVQALSGKKFNGRIAFIDPVIDPVNRVSKVRIETGNQGGNLKPEMFVTGNVKAKLDAYNNMLVIPKSAVLWTGKRSIVYVRLPETSEPVFKLREVGLGPMLGNSYVITDGLKEGEEIVSQGAFSVDAAAQLEGKPSMMNSSSRDEMPVKDKVDIKSTSEGFNRQLNFIFENYISLKDAFVNSDAKEVSRIAGMMIQALNKADKKLLTEQEHGKWMDIAKRLTDLNQEIVTGVNLEIKRKAFADFSIEMKKAVNVFGLSGKTVYLQYCPMALDDKGAFWLSSEEEIRNPYFGDQMLNCGDTRETMVY